MVAFGVLKDTGRAVVANGRSSSSEKPAVIFPIETYTKKSSKVEELIYKENCSFLMILNNTALIWMPCQISA